MDMLTQFVKIAYAGFAAGAVGDLIAESTIMEKFRDYLRKSWNLEEGGIIDCRYCVSAWACLFTVPIVSFPEHFPQGVALLAIPVAWKVSTALRGWYG